MKKIKISKTKKKTSHVFHFIMTILTLVFTGVPFWVIVWFIAGMETNKQNRNSEFTGTIEDE